MVAPLKGFRPQGARWTPEMRSFSGRKTKKDGGTFSSNPPSPGRVNPFRTLDEKEVRRHFFHLSRTSFFLDKIP